jgi:hypothetical protein
MSSNFQCTILKKEKGSVSNIQEVTFKKCFKRSNWGPCRKRSNFQGFVKRSIRVYFID